MQNKMTKNNDSDVRVGLTKANEVTDTVHGGRADDDVLETINGLEVFLDLELSRMRFIRSA